MDGDRLDFEEDDRLLTTIRPVNKRRKIIGLDDLLTDHYKERSILKERSRLVQGETSRSTASRGYDEDDNTETEKERRFEECFDQCEKQVNDMKDEDEIPLWGQKIFGNQKPPPSLHLTDIGNCELLQSLATTEVISFLDRNDSRGKSFLEGLLRNGWLSKLALTCGLVDDSITSWTFNIMLYSSEKDLEISASEFWCDVLLSKNETNQPLVRLGWLPSYAELKNALEIYGYVPDTTDHDPSNSEAEGCEGPFQNIRSWIKVISACCQIRNVRSIFSTSEVEDLLVVLIRLLLDRRLQGLSFALHECIQLVLTWFSEREWDASCKKVAHSIAYRIPKDLNCLRVVESISGVTARSKHFRSQVALEMLIFCFDNNATNVKEALELLVSLNLKDTKCDFFKLYIYVVLAENTLLSFLPTAEQPALVDMWIECLRNCSTQITSTDWRSYASKVRNKASYLLQKRSCR